jgi:uncharacterized protein YukE
LDRKDEDTVNGHVMLNSSMLKKEIAEMRQQIMKVKDSLKWMEERAAMLQEHWEGEAGTTWGNTFQEWLRIDTEHVAVLQEILDRAEKMGIILATAEQNNMVHAQEE